MDNSNIFPSDLLILNCSPQDLNEEELTKIIYADWYLVEDSRKGKSISVSAAEVNLNLPYLEDFGYSFKNCSIKKIDSLDKKWNGEKFFT